MTLHRMVTAGLVQAVLLAAGVSNAAAPAPQSEGVKLETVGWRAPDFVLPDTQGKSVAMSDYRDKEALVLIFMGTECPVANLYLPLLSKLQERYGQKVQVIGINANLGDDAAKVAEHANSFKVDFPVLLDKDQRILETFGGSRTPEVFLLDERRNVVYHGRIDDRYGVDYKRDQPSRHDLEEALKEVLAGQPVSVAETKPVGCPIARKQRQSSEASVTYANQVSRIIQNKCQNCHRPNTSAPFSLLSYEEAVNWGPAMKEVIRAGLMPPWHADPRHGTWENDRRLTDDERDQLFTWIDGGMPMGDEKQLPPAIEYSDGWVIGTPDLVLKMPEEVTIQADGTVPYQYYETPTNFEEDVWVQAAEARPGNRAVVHHIIIFFRGGKGEAAGDGPGFRRGGFLVGTAPGDMPMVLPPGVGRRVPAGSTLVWQMHYTPTGKVEKDQSEVGLIFSKEPPKYNALTRGAINRWFKIPAGNSAHKVESNFKFTEDVMLLSFMPHMHVRGKDFLYEAVFPDGRREVLLSVPRYDFNWQSSYRFAKPLFIPKGTKLHCTAHFDNSPSNPANPDPKIDVVWGDQTWEEMMIGWFDYYQAPEGEGKVAARNP